MRADSVPGAVDAVAERCTMMVGPLAVAALVAWLPAGPASKPPNAATTRATVPMCTDVYGRRLDIRSLPKKLNGEEDQLRTESLEAATMRLSKHDRLSLKHPSDPMAQVASDVDDYYKEYIGALQDAVRVLTKHSSHVMLGVMGDDPMQAVGALRSWQEHLGLPQPPLRVLDESGTALSDALLPDDTATSESGGPAYLKFNSQSNFNMLKEHEGPFRGVIITANLREGSVRQFGGLPLALFTS